jgi:hypothetical protein
LLVGVCEIEALMPDEDPKKPVQRINYNSNNYQRFKEEDDDDDDNVNGVALRTVSSTPPDRVLSPPIALTEYTQSKPPNKD